MAAIDLLKRVEISIVSSPNLHFYSIIDIPNSNPPPRSTPLCYDSMAPLLLLVFILLLSSAVLVYPFSSCRLSCSSCCKGYHHHNNNLCTSHVTKIATTYLSNRQYGCSLQDGSLFPLLAADNSDETFDSDLPIEDTDNTSITDDIIETNTKSNDDVLTSPPKYLSLGYKLATITSILSGLLLIVNIGTVLSLSTSSSSVLSSTLQPKIQNLIPKFTAGSLGYLFLSSGVCSILSSSISNNTSNIYKRLNLGTLFFGITGLLTFPAEAVLLLSSTSSSNNNAMMGGIIALLTMQLTKFITTFTSFIGWEYSVGGFGTTRNERIKNICKEIYKGLKQVRNDYAVTDERPATFYRTFWIFITINNILFNIPELVFNVQQNGGYSAAACSHFL